MVMGTRGYIIFLLIKQTTHAEYMLRNRCYVGHPISSDNGLISQKRLRKSEFYYSLQVAMGVAY